MSNEMVLSARLELKDNMTATIRKTENSLKGMERGASSAGSAVEAMAGRGGSALKNLAGNAQGADRALGKLDRRHDITISARDMATPTITGVSRSLGGLRDSFASGASTIGGYATSMGQRIKAGAMAGKEGLSTLSSGMAAVRNAGSSLLMMGLGGFGIAELAGSAINAGHNLYMMSTRMHITAGEAAQLGRVTSMAGVDTNTFMRSMMRLDGQAIKPIKVDKHGVEEVNAAQQMLSKYGVSLTDASGKLKPMNAQLEALAKGYKAASAAGEDEEFVMSTLGARGMALVPVLENLSEYQDIAGGVQGIGLDPQQAEETWREMEKLKLQAGQVGLVMANAFMPLAKEILPVLTEQFKGAAKFFKEHGDITSAAAKVAAYGLELMAAAKAAQLLFGVLKAGGGLLEVPFKVLSGVLNAGGKKGAEGAASKAASALSNMVVNARTVIVNGSVADNAASAAGDLAGGGAAGAEAKGAKGAKGLSKLGKFAKGVGKIALPLAVLGGLYEVYSAKTGEKAAATGSATGGIAGGIAGAKGGAILGGSIGAAFAGVGAAPGAAVGGLVGGIGGYMAGSSLGESIGGAIGDIDFAGKWEAIKQGATDTWESIKNGAIDVINVIVGIGATAWEAIQPYWTVAADWFNSTVWQPISDFASSAWETVSALASSAWDYICGVFSPVAGWFESTVWQPISSAVDTATSAIENAFYGALTYVEGIWNGLSGWFEDNVWGPIKNNIKWVENKYDALKEKGASITGWKGSGSTPPDGDFTGTSYFTPKAYAAGGITSFAAANVAHGLAQVNEHGGELIDLPNGSRIYPAATTERIISREASSNSGQAPNVTITGNNFVIREEADIEKIAHILASQIFAANVNFGGA